MFICGDRWTQRRVAPDSNWQGGWGNQCCGSLGQGETEVEIRTQLHLPLSSWGQIQGIFIIRVHTIRIHDQAHKLPTRRALDTTARRPIVPGLQVTFLEAQLLEISRPRWSDRYVADYGNLRSWKDHDVSNRRAKGKESARVRAFVPYHHRAHRIGFRSQTYIPISTGLGAMCQARKRKEASSSDPPID
jgi:hypothetical protein